MDIKRIPQPGDLMTWQGHPGPKNWTEIRSRTWAWLYAPEHADDNGLRTVYIDHGTHGTGTILSIQDADDVESVDAGWVDITAIFPSHGNLPMTKQITVLMLTRHWSFLPAVQEEEDPGKMAIPTEEAT